MGCTNAKSKKPNTDVTIQANSKILEQSLNLRSQDINKSSLINMIEIPHGLDVMKYGNVLKKLSGLMDLIGDTSNLPKRTLLFLQKLTEAKLKIDRHIEAVTDREEEYQKKHIFQMFVKFQPPICDLIAILLNDKPFNQSFPILRENFKEVFYQMREYQDELQKLKEESINNQLGEMTLKKSESTTNFQALQPQNQVPLRKSQFANNEQRESNQKNTTIATLGNKSQFNNSKI